VFAFGLFFTFFFLCIMERFKRAELLRDHHGRTRVMSVLRMLLPGKRVPKGLSAPHESSGGGGGGGGKSRRRSAPFTASSWHAPQQPVRDAFGSQAAPPLGPDATHVEDSGLALSSMAIRVGPGTAVTNPLLLAQTSDPPPPPPPPPPPHELLPPPSIGTG